MSAGATPAPSPPSSPVLAAHSGSQRLTGFPSTNLRRRPKRQVAPLLNGLNRPHPYPIAVRLRASQRLTAGRFRVRVAPGAGSAAQALLGAESGDGASVGAGGGVRQAAQPGWLPARLGSPAATPTPHRVTPALRPRRPGAGGRRPRQHPRPPASRSQPGNDPSRASPGYRHVPPGSNRHDPPPGHCGRGGRFGAFEGGLDPAGVEVDEAVAVIGDGGLVVPGQRVM